MSRTVLALRPRTWPTSLADRPASVRRRNIAALRTCETVRARLWLRSTSRRTPESAETTSGTVSGVATPDGIATAAQSLGPLSVARLFGAPFAYEARRQLARGSRHNLLCRWLRSTIAAGW